MPIPRTTVYRGSKKPKRFHIDPNAKASEVRQQLEKAEFIGADNESEAWRFFIYRSKGTRFSDAILGKEVEKLVPIGGMFGHGRQLYLTNINKKKNPDLMGIGATWFFNRYMSCQVGLNDADASARKANRGKFKPMMMTNVRPTSKNVAGIYDNVVVCEKGSSVTFSVNSWGAAGFGFSIKPNAGKSIVENLYITLGDHPNREAGSFTYRYQDEARQIVIDSTKDLKIPTGRTVQYQRVVVKTWRVTSYKQGGKTHTSHSHPPGLSTRHSVIETMAEDHESDRRLALAKVVPGNTITPGAPHPGDNSQQKFGTIYDLQEDDRNAHALGEIVLYFFVFKSHADAVSVIDHINAPDPSVWT